MVVCKIITMASLYCFIVKYIYIFSYIHTICKRVTVPLPIFMIPTLYPTYSHPILKISVSPSLFSIPPLLKPFYIVPPPHQSSQHPPPTPKTLLHHHTEDVSCNKPQPFRSIKYCKYILLEFQTVSNFKNGIFLPVVISLYLSEIYQITYFNLIKNMVGKPSYWLMTFATLNDFLL